FFRWQVITRTAQENACGSGTNLHWTLTFFTMYRIHFHWLITADTVLSLCRRQTLLEIAVDAVEQLFPITFTICHLIQLTFKICSKGVVHQVIEVFIQTVGDDLTHLLGKETTVIELHITTILNGRDNCSIGRWTANAFFLELFDQ